MRKNFYILILILIGGFIASCQDDSPPDEEASVITFSEDTVNVLSKGRYYTVTVNAPESMTVSCTADWIELESTSVAGNGEMVFYVMENEDKKSRETTIRVTTCGTPVATAELTVNQYGVEYNGGNDVASGALSKDFRVGWGYDICMDFMSDKSVTQPIIDYDKLIVLEKEYGDPIVDESNRSKEEMDTYTAYSLAEMSRQMTSVQDKESSFLGLFKTVTRHVKITKTNTKESQVYGYARVMKIIATRHIDEAKLDDLVQTNADIFTADFIKQRDLVQEKPTAANIKTLLDRYGTHLVVLADIGGAIDYSINFKASKMTDLEQSTTSRVQFVMGKKSSDEETKKEAEAQSSVINSELAITVMGGDKSIVSKLQNSVIQLNENSQLNGDLLSGWMNSLDVDYRNAEACKKLTVVKCKTLPIWTLFTNKEAATKLKDEVLSRVNKAAITLDLEDFGIESMREIPISNEMTTFGTSNSSTLVKLAYIDNEPRMEICNEYISGIRNDERVTVLYPIQFGMTNIRRGLFPGDGQGSPPAYVINTPEGSAYIRPIEGYGPTDQLQNVYYSGGTLYHEPNEIKPKRVSVSTSDVNLILQDASKPRFSYPIVKIGNGYWTRSYLRNEMRFGKIKKPGHPEYGYYSREHLIKDPIDQEKWLLYANYFHGNDPAHKNQHCFGSAEGLWYLPTSDDLICLLTTIGKNPKALFIGQVSGYDAEFKGYYGKYDIWNNQKKPNYMMMGENLCLIGFKDNSTSGDVLVIGADYSLRQISVKEAEDNNYPIRLFRNSSFVYPNK